MKQFIDYFWNNKDFIYDPEMGMPLSIYHLVMMSFTVLLFIILWLIGKKVKKKECFILTLSLSLFILEALRVLNFKYVYKLTWIGSFSFHMCSLGVYFAVVLIFVKKKWMYDVLMVQAIIGAPLAIIFSGGILPWFNKYSFMPIQSFITHTILFIIPLYAFENDLWQVKVKNYYISFLSVLFSIIVAYIMSGVNIKYQTGGFKNFFWTRYVDPAFKEVVDWPYPYHFIALSITFIIVGFITALILQTKQQKKYLYLKIFSG